ncbi:MAG: Hsp20/alpha crystallin family protein [Thermoanaerobaculia bacterium]
MATITETQAPPESQTSTGSTGPEHHQTQAQPESSRQRPLNTPPQTTSSTGSTASGGTVSSGGISSGGMTSGGSSSPGMTRRRPSMMGPAALLGDPFGMMRSMMDQMDRLFGDFMPFGGPRQANLPSPREASGMAQSAMQGFWYPQVEVSEREGNLVVCADLPGLRKEDVHLEVHDDYLVLEGERRQESEQNQGGVYRTERSYGRFYRTIPLPDGVNPEQVRANFKDGVLEVTVPMPNREQQQRGRRIEIT